MLIISGIYFQPKILILKKNSKCKPLSSSVLLHFFRRLWQVFILISKLGGQLTQLSWQLLQGLPNSFPRLLNGKSAQFFSDTHTHNLDHCAPDLQFRTTGKLCDNISGHYMTKKRFIFIYSSSNNKQPVPGFLSKQYKSVIQRKGVPNERLWRARPLTQLPTLFTQCAVYTLGISVTRCLLIWGLLQMYVVLLLLLLGSRYSQN